VKPRDRFAGGGTRTPTRLTGSLKALDPATGELKATLQLPYPNYSGALATAGNLVFIGHYDGTFSAHDAKTMQEVWSVNIGTGINAPPITYSVNGKQYVAVLAGSRMSANVIANAPELKHMSPASMLYVFGL
jgi:alcohol dehydrogenase (cytochrome c)